MARIFEGYIEGCVSARVLELLMQVLLLLKFESWLSCLHVRSAIDRFSQSLIHLLVNLVGQYINKNFEQFCSILTCHFSVK